MEVRAQNATPVLTMIGVDIGKDVFHIVGFGADAEAIAEAALSKRGSLFERSSFRRRMLS
jgi:hypothetical protein